MTPVLKSRSKPGILYVIIDQPLPLSTHGFQHKLHHIISTAPQSIIHSAFNANPSNDATSPKQFSSYRHTNHVIAQIDTGPGLGVSPALNSWTFAEYTTAAWRHKKMKHSGNTRWALRPRIKCIVFSAVTTVGSLAKWQTSNPMSSYNSSVKSWSGTCLRAIGARLIWMRAKSSFRKEKGAFGYI